MSINISFAWMMLSANASFFDYFRSLYEPNWNCVCDDADAIYECKDNKVIYIHIWKRCYRQYEYNAHNHYENMMMMMMMERVRLYDYHILQLKHKRLGFTVSHFSHFEINLQVLLFI